MPQTFRGAQCKEATGLGRRKREEEANEERLGTRLPLRRSLLFNMDTMEKRQPAHLCVCMRMCVRVCVCVCLWERERERGR